MADKVLVDTNVLVYAYDRSESEKQRRALTVLDRLLASGAGAVSTQVLDEFFVALTQHIASPLSIKEGYERIANYLQTCLVLDVTGLIVLEAVRGAREYALNFWDAQIWATARLNQIPVIFSEDFNGHRVIEGVQIVNPFSDDFRMEQWMS